MTLSWPSFSAAATKSSIVPKSAKEVAFADFSSIFTALPEVESAEESVLPDPQAAMEKARTAAKRAGSQFAQRNHGNQYLSYALFITTRKKISPQINAILTLQ